MRICVYSFSFYNELIIYLSQIHKLQFFACDNQIVNTRLYLSDQTISANFEFSNYSLTLLL